MKACSYCGNQYADDVAVCPIDGQPVRTYDANRIGTSLIPRQAFDVKLVSPMSRSGMYRVFVEREDLIFIRIEGGGNSLVKTLAHFLGPLGNLVPLIIWVFERGNVKERRARIEEISPEELLRESDANFKLHAAEIREASVEPPSRIAISGKAGRLNFLVRHGEKFKFEFVNTAAVSNAIRLLTPLLNSTLKISVKNIEGGGTV